MSYIKYYGTSKETPLGKIEVVIPQEEDKLNFPISLKFFNKVGGNIRWESPPLFPGCWASFVWVDNSYAEIVDSTGETIEKWEWDVFTHGNECYSSFMKWALENRGARGIAIGTHDGTTGEWVEPLRDGVIEAFLVEASLPQYKNLIQNYCGICGFYPILSLITVDGKDCMFYESQEGYTNSVLQDYPGPNSIGSIKKSRSLNDLICEIGYSDKLDWLHIDAEGIDSELILSLDDSRISLPEVIIFESCGMGENDSKKIKNWMISKGYSFKDCNWNTIAFRSF